MKPDQILDRAADLIDERGHCKGTFENARGNLCPLGAIDRATNGVGGTDSKIELSIAIGAGIPNWNDAPERTHEEVTSTMRAVAALLRAKEKQETPVEATV